MTRLIVKDPGTVKRLGPVQRLTSLRGTRVLMRADGKQEPDEGCDPLSANLKCHFVSLHVLSSMPRMVQIKKRILIKHYKQVYFGKISAMP